jgi:hypothetical protein
MWVHVLMCPDLNFHRTLYKSYATGGHHNTILYKFFTISNNNMADVQTSETGAKLTSVMSGSLNDVR